MKYPVILFDADGVMIKSALLFSEQLEKEYGILTPKMQPFFTGVFKLCSVGKADLKQELVKVLDEWGWQGSVEELLDFWFTTGTKIDEEVKQYVQSLHQSGVRCFMTTDQEKYRGEHLRRTLGNHQPFEEIFFSAEIGCSKKEAPFFETVYQYVTKTQPVEKNQILFVDDDDGNIQVAKQFGFMTHFYTDLTDLQEFLAISIPDLPHKPSPSGSFLI